MHDSRLTIRRLSNSKRARRCSQFDSCMTLTEDGVHAKHHQYMSMGQSCQIVQIVQISDINELITSKNLLARHYYSVFGHRRALY